MAQPWKLALAESSSVDPASLAIDLPSEPGPRRIGKPDPWYELAGSTVTRVLRGRGAMRREPGRVLDVLDDYEPWYAERLDGTLDAAKAISGEVRHTFIVGKG